MNFAFKYIRMSQVNLSSSDVNELLATELEPALKSTDWDISPSTDWDSQLSSDIKEEQKKTIYAISDIHTEFYDTADEIYDAIQWRYATHLVLAGDIGVVKTKLRIYKDFLILCKKKYKNVVLIPGNHEYYHCGGNREQTEKILENLCEITGVVYIHGKNIVVDGIRFIGHTLWSIIDRDACSKLADFSCGVFESRIEYVSAFVDGVRFIQSEIHKSMDHEEPLVVVTHHLPSRKLIHPRFTGYGTLNSAFATDVLSSLNGVQKIKYWFCGHTHESTSIKAYNMQLVVNPYGYPHEKRDRMTKVLLDTYPMEI